MSLYKQLPDKLLKVVDKAVTQLSKKCKPALIIKGKKPEEMVLERKSIMDDYYTSLYSKNIMTELSRYAYHRGILDGLEYAKLKDVETVKNISFQQVVGIEGKVSTPEDLWSK